LKVAGTAHSGSQESEFGAMRITEEVKTYLNDLSFAVLSVAEDLGSGPETLLLVKAGRDLVEGLRDAEARVEVGWVVEQTASGPVLCLVLRAEDEGVGELAGEVYFDSVHAEDRNLLDLLGTQSLLRTVFLDEDLEVVWLASVAWDEVQRLLVDQVRDRVEDFLEQTDDYDFERAKEHFQEVMALDKLLERSFPG
jgi:hypothetical protein